MNKVPLNDCGCCEGVEAQTPAPIENRAGLRAIAYRCGTHAQFKQSMLAVLSGSAHPELSGLNTRDDDDFTIALLDAWATTADVLTFYQERIAQESFLRTATERVSLLQLGRLIGYELRPGVASSTYLAFTLETAAGAPRSATIEIGSKVQSVPGPNEKPQVFETVEKIEARPEWNAIPARPTQPQQIDAAKTKAVYFEDTTANLKKGDVLLFIGTEDSAGKRAWDLCRAGLVTVDHEKKRTRVDLSDSPVHFAAVPASSVQVFVMRQRAALFGYNAPDRRGLAKETRDNFDAASAAMLPAIGGGADALRETTLEGAVKGIRDWQFSVDANALDLDATYPTVLVGSWVTLTDSSGKRVLCRVLSATEASPRDYLLTGKVTRLSVATVASTGSSNPTDFGGTLRSTTVLAESQELKFAESPITEPVVGTTVVVAQRLDGFKAGRVLAISGRDATSGASVSAIVTLVDTTVADGFKTLRFAPALPGLAVESVRINANVALATHGETVSEVLGNADASQAFQRFALRQPPLTYVRAPGAGGAISTLEIRVNDVLWHEVPTFFGRGPREHVYVARMGDDGVTTVQFGDGVTGARPSTGEQNIRATYRRGIGLEGLVKPDQLSLLLTRPLGVKAVSNPFAAKGAADREQLSDARSNAPLTVMTLDRIVSLRDYEDFVRAFAGVAKALATWTWNGESRGVFVTVAGPNGDEIDLAGDFGENLLAAIHGASAPGVPIRVQSYRRADGLFTVSGSVKVDPDFESKRVLAAVRSALETEFSFAARSFGQAVNLSEVITVMQSVRGVIAVDVNELRSLKPPPPVPSLSSIFGRFAGVMLQANLRRLSFSEMVVAKPSIGLLRKFRPAEPPARLVAAVPQGGAGGAILPAELLVLAPLSPEQIGVMP